MKQVSFHGRGLHGGERVSLRLARRSGPIAFVAGDREAALSELAVVRSDHGVRVRAETLPAEIDLVEHLLAAFAGLGVRSGIGIEVKGSEIPILDGCALELARGILALDPPRGGAPALTIVRDGEVDLGSSRYVFEKRDAIELEVQVDFSEAGLGVERARWAGGRAEFLERIAPARTFGFARDAEILKRKGRASWVDPCVVIVFDPDGRVVPPGAPPGEAELARHKLLDLLGDLYLFGGPPLGSIRAFRPGHAANHRAVAEALERGLLAAQS